MTDEELVLVRSRVAEHLAGVKASLARTWERSADLLVAKGTELCRIGIVSIPTTVGVIGARVVRFRWGDSVLDTSVHAERGAGSSMLRLSRVQAADPAFLAECLARSVAKLTASNPDGPD